MAKRYVLGERAARFLHEGMTSHFGEELSSGKHFTQSLLYPDPWTIRWSSSIRYVEGSSPGCWIIWLPEGCYDGCAIDTETMRPLTPEDDNMPDGWYACNLPISTDGETSVYARAIDGYLALNVEGGRKVAEVIASLTTGAKNVKQLVRSYLDLTPQPFDIVSVDPETGGIELSDGFYMVGGRAFISDSLTATECAGKIIALGVPMNQTIGTTIEKYDSYSELQIDQKNNYNYIYPLYAFTSNMKVRMDLRKLPNLSAWEPS